LFSSCGSKKDIIYFQNIENILNTKYDSTIYEIRVQPHDNLLITVSALNPDAANDFNLIKIGQSSFGTGMEWQGYLVDDNGYINFPVLGKIQVGGMAKQEVIDLLEDKISQYIESPVVNIRFMNYRIYVLGEVRNPGPHAVREERISVPQALALAGDMTIYGNRHDVLVFRTENGEKKVYHLDMTTASVFFSESYYLQQNDILYVQPNATLIRNSINFNPYISLFISSATFLLTLVTFFLRK
jgi:polysaccharide export outer membrane protein